MEGGRPDRLRPCLQARDFFASPTASECYGTERARGLGVPEVNWRMTAVGHKETSPVHQAMSALPPKADICGAANDARICLAYLIGPIDRARQNVIPITS